MDQVVSFIHSLMPVLYILMAVAVILKIIMVINNRGFKVPVILASFFRIYKNREQTDTLNKKKRLYMKYSNLLNYFLHASVLLFLLMLAIYRGDIFFYP